MNPLLLLPQKDLTSADSPVLCSPILRSPLVFLGINQQRNRQHLRAPFEKRENLLFPHHMQKLRKGTYQYAFYNL